MRNAYVQGVWQMVRFLFVRHGQSMSNVNRTFTGQADVPLSELGKKQAEDLRGFLLGHYAIDTIWSSDLLRARQTIEPVASALGLPVHTDRLLREIFGGEWEEKTVDEIAFRYPEDYAMWQNDIGLARCTGGESLAEVQQRGILAVRRIAEENDGKTVLVATHAAFLRAMQCYWQGLPLRAMKDIPWVPNASTTEAEYDGGSVRIVRLAQDGYLQGEITRISKGF